jgi:type IV pilus assembly protein PilY1
LLTSQALGDGQGVTLAWASLSSAEQTVLNTNTKGSVDNQGQQRVQWLQGVRSVEQLQTPPGNLRARTFVLGDIINSSPTFVGAPTPGTLPDTFSDKLNSSATTPENQSGAQKYSAFASANASRVNVVYAGSNDGFMHGFEAGVGGNGAKGAANNDGKEVVGYMPYDVLVNKAVNLADPLYKHDYLVDATPVAGDVFYNNAWHTWLVGGVGPAGKEIYALDITSPSSMTASKVIGDWDSSSGLSHLGNTVGTPVIARMHNGQWAIIFGSGLHKDNDGSVNSTTAGVYIGLINSTDGSVTFQFIDTGVGSSTNPDGIAYVSQVDLDDDHIADYLYAGDTQGNVWRFDVTSSNESNWKVSSFGGGSSGGGASPLFTATDASGHAQPITTSITVLAVQTGMVTRDMLFFGTGQQTPATATQGVQYAKGSSSSSSAQTFYGIWDWNMTAWNAMSSTKYAALASGAQPVTRDDLLVQTLVAPSDPSDTTHRLLSNTNVVCWAGDAATTQCATENQYGWLFDLPDPGSASGEWAGEGEQIIFNPTFISGAVVVNTAIPPTVSAVQCNPGLQSGFTMAFDPASGGGFAENFFADANGGFGGGQATVSGVKVSGVGTASQVQNGSKSYLVTQTVTGGAKLFPINPPSNDNPARVSWRELVNP